MVDKCLGQLPSWTKFLWDINQLQNPQPKFIEVDLTNYCNKNCTWCVSEETRKQQPLNMDPNIFSDCLDYACAQQLGIVFTGGGEPTLHPKFREYCQNVIDLVHDKQIPQMGLITNGGKDFSDVEWYLQNTVDPPAWIRISVNYWAIPNKLKELLTNFPNRIGLSIIYNEYDYHQSNAAKFNNEYLSENFKPKFIRIKPCHDFGHPTINPLDCQARKFVKIYETDGKEPYCCLARGLNGQPPKICPNGCPWNVNIQDAWRYNPFS